MKQYMSTNPLIIAEVKSGSHTTLILCLSLLCLTVFLPLQILAHDVSNTSIKTQNGAQESEAFQRPCAEHLDLRVTVLPASQPGSADGAIDIEVLGAVGEVTYIWRSQDFYAASQDLRQLHAGNYELIVRDERGCDLTRKISVSHAQDELPANPLQSVLIAPNPADDQVSISYTARQDERIWIEVFDQFGRTIAIPVDAKHNAGTFNTVLGLTAFDPGIYYYRLHGANRLLSGNFVVVR